MNLYLAHSKCKVIGQTSPPYGYLLGHAVAVPNIPASNHSTPIQEQDYVRKHLPQAPASNKQHKLESRLRVAYRADQQERREVSVEPALSPA